MRKMNRGSAKSTGKMRRQMPPDLPDINIDKSWESGDKIHENGYML
jgi:hypothetical protein